MLTWWCCPRCCATSCPRRKSGCGSSPGRNNSPAIAVVAGMGKAVQFDTYGGIDVLEVRDVPKPAPGAGEVLVEVKAAGINPGEAMIRQDFLHDRWPATFPSGQGSDLAGVVAEIGPGVDTVAVGDEVIGFTGRRASQAEFVVVPADQLTQKPAKIGRASCRERVYVRR